MKLVYRGSVKDFYLQRPPTPARYGEGIFEFTDDFSIFDYGKMPQQLPSKGEALRRMTAHWFQRLEEEGIPTHYMGDRGPRAIRVRAARKLHPRRLQRGKTTNYIVPLEVIFRNQIPPASSLHRRLLQGEARPGRYGLRRPPRPGETIRLRKPVVEFSTKMEDTDRYIGDREAARIGGLTTLELEEIQETARAVNRLITREARGRGLDHVDGKIEVLLGPRRDLKVADTVGTSDENRFLHRGMDVSKQMLRDYYIKEGWHANLQTARQRGMADPKPPRMEEEFLQLADEAYRSLAVTMTGERWGSGKEPPPLKEIVRRHMEYQGRKRRIKKGINQA